MKRLQQRTLLFCVLTLFTCLIPAISPACDLCAIYTANRAIGNNGTGWNVGITEQFTHFGTLKQDGQTIANPDGQSLDSSITQIYGNYNFSERFGLQLNIPIITRNYTRTDNAGGMESGSVTGIGDVSVGGHFRVWQKTLNRLAFDWQISGNIKFPSGSASRLEEELVEIEEDEIVGEASGIHGHDLALGSGSVDGVIGTHFSTRYQRMQFDADIQYSIRTRGHVDYRFANDLHWSFTPGYFVLLKHKHSLAVRAKVSGEYKSLDDLNGTPADDTGINSIFAGPEIAYTWSEHLNFELGADLPLMIHNTALQAVPDYKIRSVIAWNF